jgi:hypothetical protein
MTTSNEEIIAALDHLRKELVQELREIRAEVIHVGEKVEDAAPGSARASYDRGER